VEKMGIFDKLFGRKRSTKEKKLTVQPPAAPERKKIAFELGNIVDYRQIPKIEPYLNDEDVEVRRAAVSSLEQQWSTGDAGGIMLLTKTLQDPDPQVRKIAALAIGEFIPCAKTPLAIEAGKEAVKKCLELLEAEQNEDVLAKIFITLGNIDDPTIIPSFTEVVKKLKLSVIDIGIENIGLLRPTDTRKKMIEILQSAKESSNVISEVGNKVQCSRCGKSLVELNMSRGALPFGGRVPVLYNGIICSRCGKIECTDCRRGIPINAPCRWCGSEVYPAYDIYLKR
jgi:hypothetical protein